MIYDINIIQNKNNNNIVNNNINNINNTMKSYKKSRTNCKKQVRFSSWNIIYPNHNKIESETMCSLWWSENDKKEAYFAMNKEIRSLQKMHPNIKIQQAMKLLYQPNNLKIYDPKNFTS